VDVVKKQSSTRARNVTQLNGLANERHAPRRSIVVVSGETRGARLLDTLSLITGGYDVIGVESINRAYSCIKHFRPDVIFILIDIDDVSGCQLLSMLSLDPELSRIPVVSAVTRQPDSGRDGIISEDEESAFGALNLQLN
jgi:CheY-like chemotaxis protein